MKQHDQNSNRTEMTQKKQQQVTKILYHYALPQTRGAIPHNNDNDPELHLNAHT